MSKSNLRHEDQSAGVVDDERSIQRSRKILMNKNQDRDSVAPFAKDVIDNVVTSALSILDISKTEGKHWKDVLSSGNKNCSSEFVKSQTSQSFDIKNIENIVKDENKICETFSLRSVFQMMNLQIRQDTTICDSIHAEQVAKIVKGLQDIQIGDSAYVLPADGSNIEKQVKRAVRNINSLELGDMETVQLIIRDGQGDVDAAAILESQIGPVSSKIIGSKPQNDGGKISTCFLHKMIEELEDNEDSTKIKPPVHNNKEGIARWEESEEKFIRLIEGTNDERDSIEVLEFQETHELPIGVRNIEDSLARIQQAFSSRDEEPMINDWKNCKKSINYLDNFTDEEPYWNTAGLITRISTIPRNIIVEKRSFTSSLTGEVDFEISNKTETPNTVKESIENSNDKNSRLKLNEKNKNKKKKKKISLGKRLRNFFSKFKSSRNHC